MAGNNTRNGHSASSNSASTPASPTTVEAMAAWDDRIARIRMLPLIEPGRIVEPPEGYQPLTTDDRGNFRSFGEDLHAESVVALQHIARKGDNLQQELGPECPAAQIAADLVNRMDTNETALLKAKQLVEFLEAQNSINRHDAFVFLTSVNATLEYRQKFNPKLLNEYSTLVSLMVARGQRIVEGRQRAKKVRQLASELQGAKKTMEAAGIVVKGGQSGNGNGEDEE